MKNQQCRTAIEQVTLQVEQQQKSLMQKRDKVIKDILAALPAEERHLIHDLIHFQYLMEDAMYLAIFKASLVSNSDLNKEETFVPQLPLLVSKLLTN